MKKTLLALITAAFMAVSNFAMAELPASVGTSVAEIGANGQAIFDLVFPVVALLTGLVIVIKLFKRFANKA